MQLLWIPFASNDKRQYHEKVKRIRELRPDMLLLSGGVDGGTKSHVVEIAEIVQSANPKPRLGINYKLPIIFAEIKMQDLQLKIELSDISDLSIVDNIRPT